MGKRGSTAASGGAQACSWQEPRRRGREQLCGCSRARSRTAVGPTLLHRQPDSPAMLSACRVLTKAVLVLQTFHQQFCSLKVGQLQRQHAAKAVACRLGSLVWLDSEPTHGPCSISQLVLVHSQAAVNTAKQNRKRQRPWRTRPQQGIRHQFLPGLASRCSSACCGCDARPGYATLALSPRSRSATHTRQAAGGHDRTSLPTLPICGQPLSLGSMWGLTMGRVHARSRTHTTHPHLLPVFTTPHQLTCVEQGARAVLPHTQRQVRYAQ